MQDNKLSQKTGAKISEFSLQKPRFLKLKSNFGLVNSKDTLKKAKRQFDDTQIYAFKNQRNPEYY
jgi:hypothetical protein